MGRACDRQGVGKNWRKVIWAERVTDRGWEKLEEGDIGRACRTGIWEKLDKGDIGRACEREGLAKIGEM